VAKLRHISGTVVTPYVASPAARNRFIRSVSPAARTPLRARLPMVNSTPAAIGRESLIMNGTPANGPSGKWSSGVSKIWVAPLTRSWARLMACRAAEATSAALTCPLETSSRRPTAS
jgi:hypothetical protein